MKKSKILRVVARPALWFINTRGFVYLTEFIGKFSVKPKFPMEDIHHLVNNVFGNSDTNSIYTFASTNTNHVMSWLIRKVTNDSRFSHAGLIIFDSEGWPFAVHMQPKGLVVEDLLSLLRHIDYICINEVKMSLENYETAVKRLDTLIEKASELEYDFSQRMENGEDKFYCSEANYYVLEGLVDDVDLTTEMLYGISTFVPEKVTKVGEVVYSNHPDFNFKEYVDDEIETSKPATLHNEVVDSSE